jgi:hypothetical protein
MQDGTTLFALNSLASAFIGDAITFFALVTTDDDRHGGLHEIRGLQKA